MFTPIQLDRLREDLQKWIDLIDLLRATTPGEAGPQVTDGGPALAHLSILVDEREARMLLRLAGEIPGLENCDEVERMVKTLRYSFWHLYAATFGESPPQVVTTGTQLCQDDNSPKELAP